MGLGDLKDLGALMKQAQVMQGRLQDAQARMAAIEVEGVSGGGMARVRLKGAGELVQLELEQSLLRPEEGAILADLVIAAHADARRKLEQRHAEVMREVAGPLGGLAQLPPGLLGT